MPRDEVNARRYEAADQRVRRCPDKDRTARTAPLNRRQEEDRSHPRHHLDEMYRRMPQRGAMSLEPEALQLFIATSTHAPQRSRASLPSWLPNGPDLGRRGPR